MSNRGTNWENVVVTIFIGLIILLFLCAGPIMAIIAAIKAPCTEVSK